MSWKNSIKSEKCIAVRLASIKDLARFAASMRTYGQHSYIIHFEKEGKHYYGLFIVFRDYYKYYGLPLFYYVVMDSPIDGSYILVKADESGESLEFSEGVRAGWIPVPIITVEESPEIIPL